MAIPITPEVQAQIDEQKKECIFCKIVNGEIPAGKAYEDSLLLGVLEIYPIVKGHMLLFPKDHYHITPFIPEKTFSHLFGFAPKIIGGLKKVMLCTGVNIFIANGGAAGQQSYHFLLQILPRERGDGFDRFSLDKKKQIDEEKSKQAYGALAHYLPGYIEKLFPTASEKKPGSGDDVHNRGRTPDDAAHKTAGFLIGFRNRGFSIFEDSRVMVAAPENPQCVGHTIIYSQEEESLFEELSEGSASHMFMVASSLASLLFDLLKAHGTNIILKSGISNDNPSGRLAIHVLPRFENDGLDLQWTPKQEQEDTRKLASKVKDELFVVEHLAKEKKKSEPVNLDKREILHIVDRSEEEAEKEFKAKHSRHHHRADDMRNRTDDDIDDDIVQAIKRSRV